MENWTTFIIRKISITHFGQFPVFAPALNMILSVYNQIYLSIITSTYFFDLELNSIVNVTKKLRNSASIDVADHYVIPVKSVEGQWIQHRNMFWISKRS